MDEDEKRLRSELRNLTEREHQALKDHPMPEELVAYRSGELSEAEEERLGDHLAICRDCAALLLDLADFGNLKPPAGVPEVTDAQVDQAWQDMRSRIAKEEVPEQLVAAPGPGRVVPLRPVPSAQPARVAGPARSYAGWAVAASLIAVVSLFWGFQQRGRSPQMEIGQLVYPQSTVRGESSATFPSGSNFVFPLPPVLGGEHDGYVVELAEVNESPLLVRELKTLERQALLVPGGLSPGMYRLVIYGVAGGSREVIEDFSFTVDEPQ